MVGMQVSTLHDFASLRQVLALHPGLLEAERSHFFCSLGWFELLARCGFPPAAAPKPCLHVVVAVNGSQALCLAMHGSPPTHSLTNYYSGLFAPMEWRLNQESDAIFRQQALALAMGAACADHSRPLCFEALETDAWFHHSLATAAPSLRRALLPSVGFANWYLDVAGREAASLFAALPSKLRHTIERASKRLDTDGDWGVHIASDGQSGLNQAVEDFVQVYGFSWKAAEPNADFIPGLAQLAASSPESGVRIGVLRVRGQAMAAQFWLLHQRTAYIFKLAHVEEPAARSLGSVLTWRMLQHVVDVDGVCCVDFVSGDDAYKKDWMSARRCRTDAVLAQQLSWTTLKHALRSARRKF